MINLNVEPSTSQSLVRLEMTSLQPETDDSNRVQYQIIHPRTRGPAILIDVNAIIKRSKTILETVRFCYVKTIAAADVSRVWNLFYPAVRLLAVWTKTISSISSPMMTSLLSWIHWRKWRFVYGSFDPNNLGIQISLQKSTFWIYSNFGRVKWKTLLRGWCILANFGNYRIMKR